MRLIADESCDFAIIRGVRAASYDVLSVAESASGVSDEEVIQLASTERRLLITEDKDFGQLVFAAAKESSGIILIRYPALSRSGLVNTMLQLFAERGEKLYNKFVVLEPGKIRMGQLP